MMYLAKNSRNTLSNPFSIGSPVFRLCKIDEIGIGKKEV